MNIADFINAHESAIVVNLTVCKLLLYSYFRILFSTKDWKMFWNFAVRLSKSKNAVHRENNETNFSGWQHWLKIIWSIPILKTWKHLVKCLSKTEHKNMTPRHTSLLVNEVWAQKNGLEALYSFYFPDPCDYLLFARIWTKTKNILLDCRQD